MRILRLIAVVAALSFIANQWTPGVRAAGPVTEVLIGELLPLTDRCARRTNGPAGCRNARPGVE